MPSPMEKWLLESTISMHNKKMNEIKLLRKFNCKKKIDYREHIWLILRIQLVYEAVIVVLTCLANMSFHFHLSHVYTTQFWTSEYVASSNFALALASLLMIPYTLKVETARGTLVKDLHFTMLSIHITICFLYSHLSFSVSYLIFSWVIGLLAMAISSFAANVIEQNSLHSEIMQIESDDRKTYRNVQEKPGHDPHEHYELTQVQFRDEP